MPDMATSYRIDGKCENLTIAIMSKPIPIPILPELATLIGLNQ
jgi:hypothetical protein